MEGPRTDQCILQSGLRSSSQRIGKTPHLERKSQNLSSSSCIDQCALLSAPSALRNRPRSVRPSHMGGEGAEQSKDSTKSERASRSTIELLKLFLHSEKRSVECNGISNGPVRSYLSKY